MGVLALITAAPYWMCCAKDPVQMLTHASPDDATGNWSAGLCDCFAAPKLCCLGWCCLPILWADSMRLAGWRGFSCAVFLATILGSCVIFSATLQPVTSLVGFPAVFLFTYY